MTDRSIELATRSKPRQSTKPVRALTRQTSATQMIEAGRCGNIRVAVVADDRTPEQIESDEREFLCEKRIGELPEGFSLLEMIRGGDIYFRRGGEVIIFDYEFSGDPKVTVLVMSHPPMRWIHVHTLQSRPVSLDDQRSTKAGLANWLTGRVVRFSLDGKIQTVRKQRRIPRIPDRG